MSEQGYGHERKPSCPEVCSQCLTARITDLQAQVRTLTEERDRAKDALVCRVCGKQKPFVAICFDCLNEDVGEIARWHEEVGLSNSDGTEDICRLCHTGWPCDAIKALRLRDEANRQLADNEWLKGELNTILHPKGDGPFTPGWADLISFVQSDLAERDRQLAAVVGAVEELLPTHGMDCGYCAVDDPCGCAPPCASHPRYARIRTLLADIPAGERVEKLDE